MSRQAAEAGPVDTEYRWQLAAAILLSLATLASAWCSYQAASWSSVYSSESRSATSARIEAVRREVEASLAGHGRLLLRASGTEPLLRVMVEGRDAARVEAAVETLAAAVREAVGGDVTDL